MHARTLRYHAIVTRQFVTVWQIDSQRVRDGFANRFAKSIANSSHPSEIGASFYLDYYGYSSSSTDSRIAVVSFWTKIKRNTE